MSRHPLHTARLALAVASLTLLACGKRGDPLPPLRRTPQVPDLALAQRGDRLEIRIQAPRATTEGERLGVVTLQILSREDDAPLDRSSLLREEKAAPGERLVLSEPLPAPGTLLRVAAIARSNNRASAQSSPRLLKVADPVPPPAEFSAQLTPDGVRIRFQAPEPMPPWIEPVRPAPVEKPGAGQRRKGGERAPDGPAPTAPPPETEVPGAGGPDAAPTEPPASVPGAPEPAAPTGAVEPVADEPGAEASPPPPPRRSGFNIYRRSEPGSYPGPLNAELLEEPGYLDAEAPLGAEACYEARTVVSTDPLIESEAAPEACLRVEDRKPPAAPVGVATLPVADGLEVSWSPSGEPDLKGYRVYRRGRGGAPSRVAELEPGTTSVVDREAVTGQRYQYYVTAVDVAGNESPASATVEGVRR